MTSQRPPDLDARYRPFPSLAEWYDGSVDLGIFDLANTAWAELRDDSDESLVRAAIDLAVRAAAFDTGAIEGLYATDRGVTFSVAVQAAAWEAFVAQESGRDAARHFDAQLRAFELVLDAVTGRERISAAWLRALHETITAGQDRYRALTAVGWQELPLAKGRYKQMPNHVLQPDGTWHSYAPVDRTQDEVQRFIDEINSPGFEAAHPVVQTAYVHHVFVGIHPFADGNGRVARALSSVFLYRAAWVPMLIFADERPRYFGALHAADSGHTATLVAFVRDVGVDTIELVAQRLRAARYGDADIALRRLSDFAASAPVDAADVDLAAGRVFTSLREAIQAQADAVPAAAAQIVVGEDNLDIASFRPPGYVSWPGRPHNAIGLTAHSPRLRPTGDARLVLIFVAEDVAAAYPVVVRDTGRVPDLRLRLSAVHPVLSVAVRQRIIDWAAELVGDLLTELAKKLG